MRACPLLFALLFALLAAAACTDPFGFDPTPVEIEEEEEPCAASPDWLESADGTPPLAMFDPLPHPASECPFYRGGWQTFLTVLQPDANGRPALLSYPMIDTVFTPRTPHGPNRAYLGDIKQAGGRQILIDQNGNSLFYAIHVNRAYADFIHENGLETAEAIQAYPHDPVKSKLFFPAGVVETKSAWQIVEGDVEEQTRDFISATTTVPTLSQDPTTHLITEDKEHPRMVTVRLLAIHVAFTLPGHPEFVWASFEHSTGTPDRAATDNHRDVAPIVPDDKNPDDSDPSNAHNTVEVSAQDYLLYKAHTPANVGNKAIDETNLTLVDQKFRGQETSIYRMFPASKSNTVDPDDDISSLNHNVEALFMRNEGKLAAGDMRGHYRLLGAQWMDKPRFFAPDSALQNDDTSPFLSDHLEDGQLVKAISYDVLKQDIIENGADSDLSILAGEDRMSSTAMESFTQGPGDFNNCFTCHNTQAITAKGVPLARDLGGRKLIDPGLLNVSHVLTQFLLDEGL